MDEFLIGSCVVQLKSLCFELGRDKNNRATSTLVQVLRESSEQHDKANHIPAAVSLEELHQILNASSISMQDIARSEAPYPKLFPTRKLQCLHGRQRYEAALELYGLEAWWTVRLFCIPEGCDPIHIPSLRREIDQCYYQTPSSDGEIFRKIRSYEDMDQPDWARIWRLRLSRSKQKALRAIELRAPLLAKLDQLRPFPGLWDGFELGNIARHLSLHADDEILRYLEYVFNVWNKITLGNPVVREATDTATVQKLQLRAPSASTVDVATIKRLIQSGLIFTNIDQPELLSTIKQSILDLDTIIPSIKTFHEDMKYLSIGISILRSHIIDSDRYGSVLGSLEEIWESPGCCLVETGEGVFCEVPELPPTAQLAYQQLFLSAIRNFPYLSTFTPRCERGNQPSIGSVEPAYLARFLRGAQKLGFKSERLEKSLLRLVEIPAPLPNQGEKCEESRLNRRCGRPFMNSYKYFSSRLFLPSLMEMEELNRHPTPMVVQRHLFHAFHRYDLLCTTGDANMTVSSEISNRISANTVRRQSQDSSIVLDISSGSTPQLPQIMSRSPLEFPSPLKGSRLPSRYDVSAATNLSSYTQRSSSPDEALQTVSKTKEHREYYVIGETEAIHPLSSATTWSTRSICRPNDVATFSPLTDTPFLREAGFDLGNQWADRWSGGTSRSVLFPEEVARHLI